MPKKPTRPRRPMFVALTLLAVLHGRLFSEGRAPMPPAAPLELHVAPTGLDEARGTAEAPIRSLAQAAARIEKAARVGDTVRVVLHPGVYPLKQTFEIAGGAAGVELRALEPGRTRVTGGTPVPASAFLPVTDPAIRSRLPEVARRHVVQLDLKETGVTHRGPFPELFRGSGGLFELFWRGRRLPLARWPNEGYTTIKTVVDSGVWSGNNRRGGTFVYRDDRPDRWQAAVADGLWLKGFWRVPWQPETVRVASIDSEKRTITHAREVGGGLGSKYSKEVNGTRPGNGKENWYALNLLEELDLPGEWCVRFDEGLLYFWPPEPLADGDVLLSDLADPLVRLQDVAGAVVSGLVFEAGLGDGLVLEGGADCLVAGCEFRNLGGTAVVVKGGRRHTVRSCDVHDTGAGGIYVGGGDRKTLTPAEHQVVNNDLWRTGQIQTTYAPAVKLGAYGFAAVGCRVAHNRMHDLPHAAVLYGGNDNLFEFNEVYRVAQDSGDVGAFYTWHDWTSRGNVLRHNYVYDSPRCNAFYMDDGDSGDTVECNVIWGAYYGPFIGGGHDNVVRHNLVIGCERGVHLDDRGVSRGYTASNGHLVALLKSVDVNSPPWSVRYPKLRTILEHHPDWPTGNLIADNVLLGCKVPLHLAAKPDRITDCRIENNLTLDWTEAGLEKRVAAELTEQTVRKLVARVGADIPFSQIGLHVDQYRPTVPVRRAGTTDSDSHVFDSAVDIEASNRKRP